MNIVVHGVEKKYYGHWNGILQHGDVHHAEGYIAFIGPKLQLPRK